MNLSNEQKFLIYSLQAGHNKDKLDQVKKLLAHPLNWEEVLDSAKWHRVEPLLYHSLMDLPEAQIIPIEFMEHVKKSFYYNMATNINLYSELERLLDVFNKSGIDVILLKGSVLGKTVYDNDSIRPLSDIDIMVKIDGIEKADKILSESGYVFNEKRSKEWVRENNYHFQYTHPVKNIIIELHWHILGKSEPAPIAIKDHGIINRLWERAIRIKAYDNKALTLCPTDLLFYLCVHFLKHRFLTPNGMFRGVFNSRGSLLQLNDIYQSVRYYKDEIDWAGLELEAEKYQVNRLIYSTLYIVRNIFEADNDDLDKIPNAYDPLKIDHDLIALILNRLFDREYVFSMNPVSFYEAMISGNLRLKIKTLIHIFFPPQEIISKLYSINSSSKKTYLYYLRHMYDVIKQNKRHLSAKPTLNEARVINKWIGLN
ncbi:MAG: nucleotidyltransferase family protein [Candidatus Dadabacteria bacterium]|nr:nucleotidyltransferase family protein [Candidatus Dadabacteria bacterium]